MKKIFTNLTLVFAFFLAMNVNVNAQIVNIPDANFKAYLVGNNAINTNQDGEIQVSEAAAFTGSININFIAIYDLTGIEAFTNLTGLSITNSSLANVNISQNTALTSLSFASNYLTALDVTHNTALHYLDFENNSLTTIDLSHNTALDTLNGTNNPTLTNLDVSHNTNLAILYCYSNALTSLDVSNNPLLTYLDCCNNSLSVLTLNSGLTYLDCHNNMIGSLDVSNTPSLTNLTCHNNSLTNLTFGNNSMLVYADCYNNFLTNLNLGLTPALTHLYCNNNSLSTLVISQSPALYYVDCSVNSLTTLDVSNNTALVILWCNNNNLSALGVSLNTSLQVLHCENNSLTGLNLANGHNTVLSLKATNNPNLTCIQVDDVTWATANWTVGGGNIDNTANFSLNCSSVQISTQPVDQLLICSGNTASFSVSATGAGLTYQWRNGTTNLVDGGNISGSNTATLTINPVDTSDASSNYNVIVSGTNLLNDTSINATLTVNPLFLISLTPIDATCAGNDGVIYNTVTGGSGSYTYSWSTGSTDASVINLIPDSYFITVTDVGTGCIQTAFATINSNTQIVYIPDSIFKAYLLASGINTNGDNEIQVCEALAWTGGINVAGLNIADLTGIEAFPSITSLDCYGNLLTSLNVNSNYALTLLRCSNNSIGSLIVAQNIALVTLICNNDNLSSLNLTQNLALTTLRCYSNSLTTLDVSVNTALSDLICDNNSLTSLNVANGNDSNFVNFSTLNNPDLTCIQVDNVNWATTTWTYPVYIDSIASFSLDCSLISGLPLPTKEQSKVTIFPNPASSSITIYLSNPSPNQQLIISNLLGEEIYHQANNNTIQTTIDISKWSTGVYFYQIRDDKETLQGKFVKE